MKKLQLLALFFALFGVVACGGGQHQARQQEVAERGETVMPFDLERTTHIFEKTEFGGVQQVLSDDDDAEQIALIQSHLEEEFEKFKQGDFSDPAKIHGHDMPGLEVLRTDYAAIELAFRELESGAEITYTTGDETLITAIHIWFDAQLMDHGRHAQGHGQ